MENFEKRLDREAIKFLEFLAEKTNPSDRLGYSYYNYADLWNGDDEKCRSVTCQLSRTNYVKQVSKNQKRGRYVISEKGLRFLEDNGGGK